MKYTKLKISVLLAFAVLIVVFTLQNTEVITIKLWFWQVNTSRALMIVSSVVVGIVFGMLLPSLRKGRVKEDSEQDTDKSEDENIRTK